jgi:hypothetical protein
MVEGQKQYPLATLHTCMEEASDEFRRFRFQATVTLIGSLVVLVFLVRSVFLLSFAYGAESFRALVSGSFVVDLVLLITSFAVVLWSISVWVHQRRFISRWGDRFERIRGLENELMR